MRIGATKRTKKGQTFRKVELAVGFPFFISRMIANMAGGLISIKYGLRGINYTTVSACASSTTAIIDAYNYIKWGKADFFITGGSEAPVT